MKKQLVSVLLALTLCAALAVPVFAEPAEEMPVLEETEVLRDEVGNSEEAVAPEEGNGISGKEVLLLADVCEHEDGSENEVFVRGVQYSVCSDGENGSLLWLRPMSEADLAMTGPASARNTEEGINATSNEATETDLRYFFCCRSRL